MSHRRSFSPKDHPAAEPDAHAAPTVAYGALESRRIEAFGAALRALIRSELEDGAGPLEGDDCAPFLVRAAEVLGDLSRSVPKPRRLTLVASLVDALLSSAELQPSSNRPAEDTH